jgi:DNA repair exonuclease SbcCD ATPase subunit
MRNVLFLQTKNDSLQERGLEYEEENRDFKVKAMDLETQLDDKIHKKRNLQQQLAEATIKANDLQHQVDDANTEANDLQRKIIEATHAATMEEINTACFVQRLQARMLSQTTIEERHELFEERLVSSMI